MGEFCARRAPAPSFALVLGLGRRLLLKKVRAVFSNCDNKTLARPEAREGFQRVKNKNSIQEE